MEIKKLDDQYFNKAEPHLDLNSEKSKEAYVEETPDCKHLLQKELDLIEEEVKCLNQRISLFESKAKHLESKAKHLPQGHPDLSLLQSQIKSDRIVIDELQAKRTEITQKLGDQ